MPDSDQKPTAIVVINNKAGNAVERLIDPVTKKFVKATRKTVDTRRVTEEMRVILTKPVLGPDGKMDKRAKNQVQKMVNRMIEIATNGDSDPKAMLAAVNAFKAVMERTFGKAAPSDQELDAMKVAGIKVIHVHAPNLMNPEVIDGDTPKEKIVPKFAEAEVVKEGE